MMDFRNSNVYRNIFLCDFNVYGVVLKFIFIVGVEVRENICGLDLGKIGWLVIKVELVWYW